MYLKGNLALKNWIYSIGTFELAYKVTRHPFVLLRDWEIFAKFDGIFRVPKVNCGIAEDHRRPMVSTGSLNVA